MLPYIGLEWLRLAACSEWTIESGLPADAEVPGGPTTDSGLPETLSMPGELAIPTNAQCAAPCDPASPVWDVATEWRVDVPSAFGRPSTTPVVGHLDDEDGDGIVGSAGDLPEILVAADVRGEETLLARRGDGTLFGEFDRTFHPNQANVVIADVDGNGTPEIVALDGLYGASAVVAFGPDDTTLWTSETFSLAEPPTVLLGACQPLVTDLEGDGRPEVLCDPMVLDGVTGETLWRNDFWYTVDYGTPTVADLDLDGHAEVVFGREVFRADGTLWWTTEGRRDEGIFPAVVQLDGDPEGELVFVTRSELTARDTDGTLLWTTPVSEATGTVEAIGSPPCLADFDGDGEIEFAVAFSTSLVLFDHDGTVLWTRPVHDASSSAGCSAFDFDLDGRAEIAYADEDTFGLYCAADGAVLFQDAGHDSVTLTEFPVIADVDRDGSAEVVVSFNEYREEGSGFVVYGNPLWPGTGAVFPQPDYRAGTQDDDGTITGETASWLADGLVRARVADGPTTPGGGPELAPVIADRIGGCDGLSLSVQIENAGLVDAPPGQILEVHAIEEVLFGQISTRVVATLALPAVPSGTRSAAIRIDLGAEQIGAEGVSLSLPIRDGVSECDLENQDAVVLLDCE